MLESPTPHSHRHPHLKHSEIFLIMLSAEEDMARVGRDIMRCWDESVLQTHEHDLPDRRTFHRVTAGGKKGFRDVWEVF